jgi:hypothetical protein
MAFKPAFFSSLYAILSGKALQPGVGLKIRATLLCIELMPPSNNEQET